jgi:hypothetical protein
LSIVNLGQNPRNPEPKDMASLPWLLMVLPLLSFLGQYYFSARAGTLQLMLRHPTVTYADWIFAPFNFLAAKIIDWKRGLAMYVIGAISSALVIATHALWQSQGADPGHMITKGGVVLAAGWVHIVFSILEMTLLVAFVFCRKPRSPLMAQATALAAAYFVTMAVSGYAIHHRLILSDACVSLGGLFFVLLYPRIGPATRPKRDT